MRAISLVLLAVPSAAFVAPSLSRPARASAILQSGQPSRRVTARSASGSAWAAGGVPDRAFGCELELLCKRGSVKDIQAAVQEADEPVFVSGEVNRDTTKYWKLVPDASLPPGRGYELVSPILRGSEGRGRLAVTLDCINHYDLVTVDKQCGYHVHIDLAGIDFQGLKRICQNWVKYEDAIDLILPPSRRGDENRFARSVRENHNFEPRYNKEVNDRIAKAKNIRALRDLMNPIIKDSEDEFYNPEGRYYKVRGRRAPPPMRSGNLTSPPPTVTSDEPQDRSQKYDRVSCTRRHPRRGEGQAMGELSDRVRGGIGREPGTEVLH